MAVMSGSTDSAGRSAPAEVSTDVTTMAPTRRARIRKAAAARGIRDYQVLGFTVQPGGQHPQFGTHNAAWRLDTRYIELIAVRDEAVARAGPDWPEIDATLRAGLSDPILHAGDEPRRGCERLSEAELPGRLVE